MCVLFRTIKEDNFCPLKDHFTIGKSVYSFVHLNKPNSLIINKLKMFFLFTHLTAGVAYFSSAVLLLTKARIKAVTYLYPSRPLKALIAAFLALGMFYFFKIFLAFDRSDILNLFITEDHYFRIVLTSLPVSCMFMSSITSREARKLLFKRELVIFSFLFPVIVVVAGIFFREFSVSVLLSHFFQAICLACVVFEAMLFYKMNKKLVMHHSMRPGEARSLRRLMFLVLVLTLASYLFLLFGIYLPVKIFYLVSLPLHVSFLNAILMKDASLICGAKWVEETQIYESQAFAALQEVSRGVCEVYRDIYRKMCDYMEQEQAFLSPTFTREEMAAAVGTNTTYVSRALSQHADMNFKQFVNAYRVRYAQEYFKKHPETRLIELCTQSGFQSLSALNMAFRTHVGMTPGEWCRIYCQRKKSTE